MIAIKHSDTISCNGINIHYISYTTKTPNLLCLHGLTANAYAFQGLIEAGLTKHFEVISVDLRGRGKSSQPAFGYSISDHAKDVIALLDQLQIKKISVCGHSFGGLLSTYLAHEYPDRFDNIFILDAGPKMNPKAPQMLMPALARIDKKFASFDEYLNMIKQVPYMHFWDKAMLPYYQADVETYPNGSVECISDIGHIMQISTFVSLEPWQKYFTKLRQPSVLFVGTKPYTLDEALFPVELAHQIHAQMNNSKYIEVDGNHHTMLYKFGAEQIVAVLSQYSLNF
jgi:pimeloyl-ACP methyl ester carboxylesterase